MPEPEAPTLTYAERQPAAPLRGAVECFWQVTDATPRAPRAPEHVVPDGCPELIVHLGEPFSRRIDGRFRRQRRAFLAGTLSRPWLLRAGRTIDTFGVRFRPAALPSLVEIDMRAAVDRELPLAELVGARAARELAAALAGAGDLETRAVAAERWIAALPKPRAAASASRAAVERILAARGGSRVEEVARAAGLSRRQLERAFARDLGIGPKLFARIVRLQAALLAAGHEERLAGVEVALAAGYFDQSHLARDFRGLAGRPARRPRAADGEMSRHFTAPERLLALLAGE